MPRRPTGASDAFDLGAGAGISARVALVVADGDTALALGSGDVAVLGTPRLMALCEEASCRTLDGRLGTGKTSVATRVQFDHLAPVPVGATVHAEATLVRVDGRRLHFTVSATRRVDSHDDLVGAGRLTRVIVEKASFLRRAGAEPQRAEGPR